MPRRPDRPRHIPVKVLRDFAKAQGFQHAILYAHDEGSDVHHVMTWGKTVEDCAQAADFGNKLKDALGWPASLHGTPSRVKRLQKTLLEVKAILAEPELHWDAVVHALDRQERLCALLGVKRHG